MGLECRHPRHLDPGRLSQSEWRDMMAGGALPVVVQEHHKVLVLGQYMEAVQEQARMGWSRMEVVREVVRKV
ncbi:hypothetical protein WG66_010253 [Moniliophthora roreri]|nr:hypothetical protein WG66_010253 [Moniliophthora roreri]